MTPTELNRLKSLLLKAEQNVIDKINAEMPGDDVPDRIAIPKLNRLEQHQLSAEAAFRSVRIALEQLE